MANRVLVFKSGTNRVRVEITDGSENRFSLHRLEPHEAWVSYTFGQSARVFMPASFRQETDKEVKIYSQSEHGPMTPRYAGEVTGWEALGCQTAVLVSEKTKPILPDR